MNIRINRTFLPVGHGAFFVERLYVDEQRVLTAVYDGGSAEEGDNTRFKISSNGYLLLKYGFIKNEIDNHTRSTEINSGITQDKFDKIFNFNN